MKTKPKRNVFPKLWGLFFLLLFFLAAHSVAAQVSGPVIVINQVNDQNFPQITTQVTALDNTGLALQGLGAADFLVWEDGQAVPTVTVAQVPADQSEPINLVLALDVSGSMEEADQNGILKIDAARSEAKSLLSSLGPNDQIAIISFSEQIVTEQPFTTDRAALNAAVDRLQLAGDTALNNALFEAATLTDNLPPGKKAIILLTDGLNTHGDLTLDDAVNKAVRSGVPVYTVGFFTGGLDATRRTEAVAALNRIATVTNGRYFEAPTAAQLGVTFKTLAELLRLQYEIKFDSGLVADCKTHELKIRVTYQGQDGDDFDTINACPNSSPTVDLTGPADGAMVSKAVSFAPQITPDHPIKITGAEYLVDDASRANITASPFNFDWDITNVASGPHKITALISDSTGAVHSIERMINVEPPLRLLIIRPSNGEQVSDEFEAAVQVTGQGQVSAVEFWWDDEQLATMTAPPYVHTINARQYLDGEYTLQVRAREVDGYSVEDEIKVNVKAVTTNSGLWIAFILGIVVLGLVIPLGIRARRKRGASKSAAALPVRGIVATEIPATMAQLVVISGPDPGQQYCLSNSETTLGRSRAENDIPTPGRLASRQHAVIKVTDGQYIYYDLSPTNPTIINEQEIVGSHELCAGDQIEIGDSIFEFSYTEA